MRILLLACVFLASGILSGCSGPDDTTTVLRVFTHAIFSGRVVVSDSETPVEGALVEGRVLASDCEANRLILRDISTGANGDFFVRVDPPNIAPFEGCLTVIVTPPEESGLSPADTSGIRLDFVDYDSVPDTAFVEVSLPRQ